MPRTSSGLRAGTVSRIAELEQQRPEWEAWLALLDEVNRQLGDAGWADPVLSPGSSLADAPLLHGQTLRLEGGRAEQLMRRLCSLASRFENADRLGRYSPDASESVRLIAAAVRQDGDEIAKIAELRHLEAAELSSVAHLAALPLIRSAAAALQDRIPRHWPHGYCPVCAAWPIFAERRGLDRSRRLRCGRCAGEWEIEWLTCVYCGERDHHRLGSLVPEDGDGLQVETCASCKGYLKSMASLQAIPPFELQLRDLETVEFDLVALEHGYCRPAESGFRLEVELGA